MLCIQEILASHPKTNKQKIKYKYRNILEQFLIFQVWFNYLNLKYILFNHMAK